MKVPAIVAVMVLGAASMMAQAAASSGTAAAAPAPAAAPAKPAEHAACKHEMAKSGTKKECHCMKNKDGKTACPHMKKEAATKS